MAYVSQARREGIIAAGPGGRASKSSYDGKRKEGSRGNALKSVNRIQSGTFGQGNLPTPDLVGRLAIGGKSPGCQYGRSAKEIASPSNTQAIKQRTKRQAPQIKRASFPGHPQHGNWRQAIAKAPSKRIVGT